MRHAADADIDRLEKAVAELDDPVRRLDRVLAEYLPETTQDQSWVIWVDAWGHAIRSDRLRDDPQGARPGVERRARVRDPRRGRPPGSSTCPDPAGSARRLSAMLDGLGLDVILHGGPSRRRLPADARIAATAEVGLAPDALG